MSVRKLISTLALMTFTASPMQSQAHLPRKSPEFSINKTSGDQILLSSLKGKVVVIEFMFVASPHCLRLAEMLNKLQGDLSSRGFQSVAVAFGPNADQAMVGHVAEKLKLNYPVGYATSDQVDAYLSRQGSEKLKIPQMVVVDRKGVIRAATGGGADTRLEDEAALRSVVESLLKETVPTTSPTPNAAASKSKN
jgi:peroxiredoxin